MHGVLRARAWLSVGILGLSLSACSDDSGVTTDGGASSTSSTGSDTTMGGTTAVPTTGVDTTGGEL